MLEILFYLSYYKIALNQVSEKHLIIFSEIEYGFNRNAKVFLNFSKLSSKIVFGLGSKKEINHLNSLISCLQYCNGQKKVSKIQFLINNNDTNLIFTIPSKSILIPFSISCDELQKFNIELNILNNKNHLDYRYQKTMTFDLAFMIISIIISILYTLSLIFIFKVEKVYLIIISILPYTIAIHSILSYMYINKKKNQEFHKQQGSIFYIADSIIAGVIILIWFSLFEFVHIHTEKFKMNFKLYIVFPIFVNLCFFTIMAILTTITSYDLKYYFITIAAYLLYFCASLFTPTVLSQIKIAFIILLFVNFFAFNANHLYFGDNENAVMNCNVVIAHDIIPSISYFIMFIVLFFLRNVNFLKRSEIQSINTLESENSCSLGVENFDDSIRTSFDNSLENKNENPLNINHINSPDQINDNPNNKNNNENSEGETENFVRKKINELE